MSAKIYTKNGDSGKTGLIGGDKVLKNDPRIKAYGALDELNSLLGLLISYEELTSGEVTEIVEIQKDLMKISAYLATPKPEKKLNLKRTTKRIETWIDNTESTLPKLKNFIIPGGTVSASVAHVIRTVCRRAERDLVELYTVENFDKNILAYVNRLSDLFFVLARSLNKRKGVKDVLWK